MLSKHSLAILSLAAAAVIAATTARAGAYTEVGDAGQTLATSQMTFGIGSLTTILGSLSSSSDVDIFQIVITNPAAFSASTVNVLTGAQNLDTELFLFNSAGRPVYANDDAPGGASVQSLLPTGNSKGPLTTGLYYLAIGISGDEPFNFANQLLFATSALSTDVRGPNGAATGPLVNFDPSGITAGRLGGLYEIDLTGVQAAPDSLSTILALAGTAFALLVLKRRSAASIS